MVGLDKEAAFFLAPFRACGPLLRSALALRARRLTLSGAPAERAGSAGLSMSVSSVVFLDESEPFPGVVAVAPRLGAALVVFAGMHRRPAVSRLVSTPPAVTI